MKIIGNRQRFGSHLGLERIESVCARLANPQRHLKFIHIAGTSGKGSVAAMLASVLQASGLRVGLFTSPHLEDYRERFQVNGQPITGDSLSKFAVLAEEAIQDVERSQPELGPVTEFELATALAFLYFLASQVDIVVLEAGLGGRLDSTNIVHPQLAVITSVGYDHVDRLGTSLRDIAWEKGGIIKQGVPVVSGVEKETAAKILKEIAHKQNAPFRSTADVPWQSRGWGLKGGDLFFPAWGEIHVNLLGAHQLQNAAIALLALDVLRELGFEIPQEPVIKGMHNARWPGRLEIVSQKPFLVLDGAHNEEGLASLAANLAHLQAQAGMGKFTFVYGMLQNKDPELMMHLFPVAQRFIFTTADSGRLAFSDPFELADYAIAQGRGAIGFTGVAEALGEAMRTPPVAIAGSLYLVGNVKRYLRSQSLIM